MGLDVHESYEVYTSDETATQEYVSKVFEIMEESGDEMNVYTNSIDETAQTKRTKASKGVEKASSKKLKLFASNEITCLSEESGKYHFQKPNLNASQSHCYATRLQ